MTDNIEGWTWIIGAKKWHYIRNAKSICGKWWMPFLRDPGALESDDKFGSKHNCKACEKLRKVEIESKPHVSDDGSQENE